MATAWMIILIKFIPFQRYYISNEKIPKDKIVDNLYYGKVILYFIFGFNLIYIMEFIWNNIIIRINIYL